MSTLWLPASMGELPVPVDFQWPTPAEYSQLTSAALAQVRSAGYSVMDSVSFPGSDIAKSVLTNVASGQTEALSAVLEAAVGKSLEALGVQGAGALVGDFVGVMRDALDGNLQAVVIGSVELVGKLAETLSGIPIVGQIAGAVCSIISIIWEAFAARAAGDEEARQLCFEGVRNKCERRMREAVALPTSATGTTPADLFRQSLYAYRSGSGLPLNVGSMYILLCGGETQGFGMDRAYYDSVMGSVRALHGAALGIHPEIQRTMWKLIKGVMSAVENPAFGQTDLSPIGDQGRSLFPILQDIIRNEYVRWKTTGKGGWNDEMAGALADVLTSQVTGRASVSSWSEAGVHVSMCDCTEAGPPARLDVALVESVRQWELQLKDFFWKGDRFVFGGGQGGAPKAGRISITSAAAKKIIVASSGETSVAPAVTTGQKVALAASGLGGSYLLYRGAKLLLRRRG
jgi:hypothetical protein